MLQVTISFLKIAQGTERRCDANGVEYSDQVNNFLRDCPCHRRQISESRGEHSDHAEGHAANRGLQGNVPYAPGDMDQFVDPSQGSFENDGVGGL